MEQVIGMSKKDKILVVDDLKLNRSKLQDILSKEYDVLEAENGEEGLKLLAANKDQIVAVILDLVMPVLDGFGFLEVYKENEAYKNLPVIIATSEEDIEYEKRCLKLGVWDFVKKPFDPDILHFRIVNAITRSQIYTMEHDPLTGLFNQQKFYQAVRELLEIDREFVFIRIDIDRFKLINSFYGTKEGDRLIQFLAEIIDDTVSDIEDCCYGRITADIFCVCMPRDDEKILLLENAVKDRLKNYKVHYYLESSIGIYVIEDNTMDVSNIYDKATVAANRCKNNYMVQEVVYTKEMEESLIREQQVINEMDNALEGEEFIVYFQPKYNLNSFTPSGAEALVRWKKPNGSMVSPGEFIPIFERNGFIIKLDYYVWEKVCQFIRKNLDEGKTVEPISVNVSRVNLYNPKFLESLINLVEKYKIPPRYLHLELTESVFSDDASVIQNAVDYLHRVGFTILMDDFGSGYSSLNVLKDINMDVLKIDMKFFSKGPSDEKCIKIIEAVINMAESLGMPVIAEGVEEEEQVKMLKRLGCDYIQGYYFAKPMPVQEYVELVERGEERKVS